MAEYIIKDAALKALCQVSAPTPSESYIVEKCIEKINRLPMMEVVRCKDCKQWSRNSGVAESPNGHCFYHDIETNGHDFCSCGERREGE